MIVERGDRYEDNFTILGNDMLLREDLSYRARGILAALMARPRGWRTDSTTLARQGREGREAILTALKELSDAGYLVQAKSQDPKTGRWTTRAVIHSRPVKPQVSAGNGFPDSGDPDLGDPHSGPPDALPNTDTKDLEQVGSPDGGLGLAGAGSPLRADRAKVRPKPAKKKRAPLTETERAASWNRFRAMDLEDLDDDIDVRRLAFTQLEDWENAFEPDRWAQSMIDSGQWAGYVAGRGLGYQDDPEDPWATSESA